MGRGLGVSRYNDEGNWSALFAMMFKDSHNEWQPAMGYGWEKGWFLDNAKDFRLGLGAAGDHRARRLCQLCPAAVYLPAFLCRI